jgi:hypothetical protein
MDHPGADSGAGWFPILHLAIHSTRAGKSARSYYGDDHWKTGENKQNAPNESGFHSVDSVNSVGSSPDPPPDDYLKEF